MFTMWRTDRGRLGATYSSNGGSTWEQPFWMSYSGQQGGAWIKNPRSSITPFRLANGDYLMLFSNNGDVSGRPNEAFGYGLETRYVSWITYGRVTSDPNERHGTEYIEWTQPEIALYYLNANPTGTPELRS